MSNSTPAEPSPTPAPTVTSTGSIPVLKDGEHHKPHDHPQSFWLWIMCLTGVDYFSTLGYQPSIAYVNAGLLAPLATIVLVLVTLFGAYPVYAFVAKCSSQGQGSIGMLAKLVSGWGGKLLVLTLLGFAATDFVITKTLSAADAAKHLIENPNWPLPTEDHHVHERQQLLVTFFMLVVLGGFFMRGFREVISLAVGIVAVYLVVNTMVIGAGLVYITGHPELLDNWWADVIAGNWHLSHTPMNLSRTSLWSLLAVVIIIFPKLALGLSGFETGVAVMPLIRGNTTDTTENPAGRIKRTKWLLLSAALIMSVGLLGSSIVVSTLIPPEELLYKHPEKPGEYLAPDAWGEEFPKLTKPKAPPAYERALAYLAHGEAPTKGVAPYFGATFGTIYDISTVVILWFAGASAMAGLLNLVPKYLPQYGMAPEWTRAVRPLVLLLTGINLFVTYLFNADVTAQGDAYATGVLVLMTSAAVATVIEKWRTKSGSFGGRLSIPFLLIAIVFCYTTLAIIFAKRIPTGLLISMCFIGTIMATSFVSRIMRSRELRFAGFKLKNPTSKFLWDTIRHLELTILVPHRPGRRSLSEKETAIRKEHRLPKDLMIVFVEVELQDASDFVNEPIIEITQEEGRYILKITGAASIAHTLAAVSLEMAKHGQPPEIHFGWTDETPWTGTLGFLLFGEGNVPWMVRELIRNGEPNPAKRPFIIIAGA
ncbi:MAG: amino acid transporter [Fimbriiglobus sp.]